MDLKTEACEQLLALRIEAKIKSKKADGLLNRIHVALPTQRDVKERPPCIPEAVLNRKKEMETDVGPKKKLAKELEQELGDDYEMNLQEHWILENEDEKTDVVPEIYLGKNISDFIDPDIMKVCCVLLFEADYIDECWRFDHSRYYIDGLSV